MMRRLAALVLVLGTFAPALAQADASKRRLLAGAGAVATTGAAADSAPKEEAAPGFLPLPSKLIAEAGGTSGAEVAGPDTPRGAVVAYLRASRARSWAEAAHYLDLADVPEAERAAAGPMLARRLKIVLDQKLWIDTSSLSPLPGGEPEDGLPDEVDRVGAIEAEGTSYEINLWKREPEPGKFVWQFTPGTLRRLEPLYEAYGWGALGDRIPDWLTGTRVGNVAAWQWIGLVLLAAIAYGLSFSVNWTFYRVLRFITRRTHTTLDDVVIDAAYRPVRGMMALLLFIVGSVVLHLSIPARQGVMRLAGLIWIALVAWALVRLVDGLLHTITRRMVEQGRSESLATLAVMRRTLKALVIFLAVLAALQNWGVNVSSLLAGLGIVGIAVSLAAQKTIENVFGGIVLSADQPVRVGDFCRFGDKEGTIEDIGLRSTRVRTLDRTVISVPNAEFSTVQIENFNVRDKIRLRTVLNLRYETTPDQLRFLLTNLRELLLAHPKVDPEGLRVRFIAFGAASLDVEVLAYVQSRDFNEFAAIREDILLRVMDLVGAAGTGFAFPSQTLYLRRDAGNDEEARTRAESQVRDWRSRGTLPFPEIPPERATELRGTLDYPPRGSGEAPPPKPVEEG